MELFWDEQNWVQESELLGQEIELENQRIHDELLAYRTDAIDEAVDHFLKPGKLGMRGNPETDDSRYFFNREDIEEVLKKYKENSGDEKKIGVMRVEGMISCWEIYRIDISPNAEKNRKERENKIKRKQRKGVV